MRVVRLGTRPVPSTKICMPYLHHVETHRVQIPFFKLHFGELLCCLPTGNNINTVIIIGRHCTNLKIKILTRPSRGSRAKSNCWQHAASNPAQTVKDKRDCSGDKLANNKNWIVFIFVKITLEGSVADPE